ncbi:MAG TPA: NAD(P)/FAD-dependent oxidoreductase [Polyangia bacterium]|jgi:NADH dehydrogenase
MAVMAGLSLPRVVIIGGGFGGLNAALGLADAAVQVTVVDRRNHHVFQPLLYQVATAALNPSDIAAPIRGVLRQQANARVLLAEVTAIDLPGRRVHLPDEVLPFDFLVLATGATHSYFGHPEWATFAPGLKTLEDAVEIRRRVLLAYEAAERTTDADERRALLTFVIVGAGPTGVELAGALAEIARHALAKDFRRIDPTQARVLLVEGQPRVLPPYPETLSASATRQLEKLGVEVRVGARVQAIDDGGVTVEGERIAARTVLWAAGVAASPLARSLGAPLDRAGRVIVDGHLHPPGCDAAWIVGDLAAVAQHSDGADDGSAAASLVPGVAPAAIQGGQYAARAIAARARGNPDIEPFHYVDKGSLATIGRAAAVADFGKVKLSGFFAWLAWGLIHIMFLIGYRNRLLVMLQWLWQYVTFQRGARLITGTEPPVIASAKAASGGASS